MCLQAFRGVDVKPHSAVVRFGLEQSGPGAPLRNEPYDVGTYLSDADERSVEVHIDNLRRKLRDEASVVSGRWGIWRLL